MSGYVGKNVSYCGDGYFLREERKKVWCFIMERINLSWSFFFLNDKSLCGGGVFFLRSIVTSVFFTY